MRNLPLFIMVALILAGLGGVLLFGGNAQDRRLDASVIGFDALEPWLERQGLNVERSNPRIRPNIEELSLRILPLYDTDLDSATPEPADARAAFYASDLRDLNREDVEGRLYEMATLVVLPKWVAGTAVSNVAHESALIPEANLHRLTRQLRLGALKVRRHGPRFASADLANGKVALFHAQLFDAAALPDVCTPDLTLPEGVLIATCQIPGSGLVTHVLSDPDLMNNHGLTLADNAEILTALLKSWIGDDKNRPAGEEGPRLYLDLAGEDLVTWYDYEDEAQDYERDSTDFARFFQPPLTGLWAMLLIVLGVAFWRGALRFGPLAAHNDATPEQSKTAAIASNARLLRIAGHDGRMAAEFVQASLHDLASTTFGRATGAGAAGQTRLFAHLARRDAAATHSLQALVGRLTDPALAMPPAELRRSLETFRSLLEKLTHV